MVIHAHPKILASSISFDTGTTLVTLGKIVDPRVQSGQRPDEQK
jgi:hypothetical protein